MASNKISGRRLFNRWITSLCCRRPPTAATAAAAGAAEWKASPSASAPAEAALLWVDFGEASESAFGRHPATTGFRISTQRCRFGATQPRSASAARGSCLGRSRRPRCSRRWSCRGSTSPRLRSNFRRCRWLRLCARKESYRPITTFLVQNSGLPYLSKPMT